MAGKHTLKIHSLTLNWPEDYPSVTSSQLFFYEKTGAPNSAPVTQPVENMCTIPHATQSFSY